MRRRVLIVDAGRRCGPVPDHRACMHAGLGAGGPGRTAPPCGPRPPAPEELASCACAAEAAVPVSEGESVPDFEDAHVPQKQNCSAGRASL